MRIQKAIFEMMYSAYRKLCQFTSLYIIFNYIYVAKKKVIPVSPYHYIDMYKVSRNIPPPPKKKCVVKYHD